MLFFHGVIHVFHVFLKIEPTVILDTLVPSMVLRDK